MTDQNYRPTRPGLAAAIPCDRDMRFDKDRMDEREVPVQDRPEPEAPSVKEPLSDDDERHDPAPLRT